MSSIIEPAQLHLIHKSTADNEAQVEILSFTL